MINIDSFFLLNGLTKEDKNTIMKSIKNITHFEKGDTIYSFHSYKKAMGYIVSGSAYAVSNNPNKLFMKKFETGMCFGVAALFGDNNDYVSTIISKTESSVLFITEEELKKIFLLYPITAINYIKFLSDKIRFLNTKLNVISCSSSEDTVLKYLMSVCDNSGIVKEPENMTLISKMLGLGRATLYRCLDTLEKNGNIIRENNYIKVIKNEKDS